MGLSGAGGQQQAGGRTAEHGGRGDRQRQSHVSHTPGHGPTRPLRRTQQGEPLLPKIRTPRPQGPPGGAEAGSRKPCTERGKGGGRGSERREKRREQDRKEGKKGLRGRQGLPSEGLALTALGGEKQELRESWASSPLPPLLHAQALCPPQPLEELQPSLWPSPSQGPAEGHTPAHSGTSASHPPGPSLGFIACRVGVITASALQAGCEDDE